MCKTNVYITRAALAPHALVAFVSFGALVGCEPAAPSATQAAPVSDAGRSPNASLAPAPLTTEAPKSPPDFLDQETPPSPEAPPSPADADPRWTPPDALATTGPLPADVPPFPKEPAGLTVEATFRFRDVPPPPRAAEVSADAHRDAQKASALTIRADLAELGRMRLELIGGGFLFPVHTELRSRLDRFGHVIVWPGASMYRVIPFGALRVAMSERRADVMPLSVIPPKALPDGRRLGISVRRLDVASSVASIRMELGRVPESGEGATLFCRALVELGGVDPRTPACQAGEVPLFVSYAWQEGGGITFEVTSLTQRADLGVNGLLVPPSGAEHRASGLPAVPRGILLSREALASLRTAAVPVPAARDSAVPGEGFVAENQSDRMMVMLLDGIETVWVPPFAEQYVVGPLRGRYGVQWRSFLGDKVAPARTVEVPARLVYGAVETPAAPDGGSP